jgi:hypothetical protein
MAIGRYQGFRLRTTKENAKICLTPSWTKLRLWRVFCPNALWIICVKRRLGLEKEDARSVFERMSRDWVDQLRMRDLDFIQSISGIPDANHLVIEMLAEATSSRIEHLGGMFTILFQILAAQKRR